MLNEKLQSKSNVMYENTYNNKDAQKTGGTSQIDIPLLKMNGGGL